MSEKNERLLRFAAGGKRKLRWDALSQRERAKLRRRLHKTRARYFLNAAKFQEQEGFVPGKGRVPVSNVRITHFNDRGYPELGVIVCDGESHRARFVSGLWHALAAAAA